jgi:hypothetical protein
LWLEDGCFARWELALLRFATYTAIEKQPSLEILARNLPSFLVPNVGASVAKRED